MRITLAVRDACRDRPARGRTHPRTRASSPTSGACGRCSTSWSPGWPTRTGGWCARSTCGAGVTIWLTIEERLAAGGSLDDERVLGDAVAAADATGRRAGGGHRLLHGRHVRAQGRGHRAVRPGGGVLRHGPRARHVAQRHPGRAARRAGVPRGVPGPGDRRHGRPLAARPTTWTPSSRRASRSCATRAPTTASSTIRRVRRTGPTTPPTPGDASSPTRRLTATRLAEPRERPVSGRGVRAARGR